MRRGELFIVAWLHRVKFVLHEILTLSELRHKAALQDEDEDDDIVAAFLVLVVITALLLL